jgi:hypothetical protein
MGVREMSATKMMAIMLVVAGILGLVYGGLGYASGTHETKPGPTGLAVNDKETVNMPVWAGIGAIVIGGLLLKGWKKKRLSLAEKDQMPVWTPDALEASRKDSALRKR